MSGCFDKVRCSCDCLEPAKEWLQPKRNMFASILAGTLVYLNYLKTNDGRFINTFFCTVCPRLVGRDWCVCWVFWAQNCSISHMWHLFNNCTFHVSFDRCHFYNTYSTLPLNPHPLTHTHSHLQPQDQCCVDRPGDWWCVHWRLSGSERSKGMALCWVCLCLWRIDRLSLDIYSRISCYR